MGKTLLIITRLQAKVHFPAIADRRGKIGEFGNLKIRVWIAENAEFIPIFD